MRRVLVVDPDEDACASLHRLLSQEGCQVVAVTDVGAALSELAGNGYDGVFCAVHELAALRPGQVRDDAPLVVATAPRAALGQGIAAVESGAVFDCLVLPAAREDVSLALGRAARFAELRDRAHAGRGPAPDPGQGRDQGAPVRPRARTSPAPVAGMAGMVGASPSMKEVFETIEKVARHKAAVLITGESGTGKELVARAIHDLSPRKSRSFVAINCGAIPVNLLESELFGYRRGAFTDAVRDKAGLFETADGGTLFLDEIGELPLNLQVKLLRALQEEEIRRIGDNRSTKVDVRIIAATLRNLSQDVANGRFREDLYYRLNVLPIVLPPLRERREDIRALAEHFVATYRRRHRGAECRVEGISDAAMAVLEGYDWPGNIRELENTIERAMVLADGPLIEPHLLDEKLSRRPATPARPDARATTGAGPGAPVAGDDEDLSLKKHTRRVEESLIRRALERTAGNRHNASKLLGISYRALLYKIKEYGI